MDFESMNLLLKRKPTKISIELEVNKKYPLLKMMVLDTKYGPNIKNETPEFFCFIPNRYYQYLKESGVKKIDMINQGRPIYILSMGAVSKTIALTNVLNTVGILPDGIIGHSLGELGCAYADGSLTYKQVLLAAYARGEASNKAKLIRGTMAEVGLGYLETESLCPPSIEVACHNGPTSCTISGPENDMKIFVEYLQSKDVFARPVNVSNIPYHSRYIKPAKKLVLEYLREIIPDPLPRSSKWISTSVPEEHWNTDVAKTSSAEYHTNNMLNHVLFEESTKHIPRNSILIEISPHGFLQAILRKSFDSTYSNISLTNKFAKNELHYLLSALGGMYVNGIDINASAIYPQTEYPVSRGTKSLCNLVRWDHTTKEFTTNNTTKSYAGGFSDITISLGDESYKFLNGHRYNGYVILPVLSYLVQSFAVQKHISTSINDNVVFTNLEFREVVTLLPHGHVAMSVKNHRGSGYFEITAATKFIASGAIKFVGEGKFLTSTACIKPDNRTEYLSENDVYNEFLHRGHQYTASFKPIQRLTITTTGIIGTIRWLNSWEILLEGMLQIYLFYNFDRTQAAGVVSSIREIIIRVPKLQKLDSDIEVIYDIAANSIQCEAIQIFGISAVPYENAFQPASLDVINFTGLNNAKFDKMELGINLSIHTVLESYCQYGNTSTIIITELDSGNTCLQQNIRNVTNRYPSLNANITKVTHCRMIAGYTTKAVLIVVNSKPTRDHIMLVISSDCFLLAQTNESTRELYPDIIQVLQFSCVGVLYSLLRKRTLTPPIVINDETKDLSTCDFNLNNSESARRLEISNSQHQGRRTYFVSNRVPLEGIYNFAQNVRTSPNMKNTRFLFILDKHSPRFNIDDPFYKKIMQKDLALIVVKNGNVGVYVPVPTVFQKNLQETPTIKMNISKELKLDTIRFNINIDKANQVNIVDYAGYIESGTRAMGLANIDVKNMQIIPDPILQWPVPDKWSLHDAATIPFSYTLAHYALVNEGKIKPGKTVLIDSACSSIGIAASHLAIYFGCTVYAIVHSDAQKVLLQNNTSFLKGAQILSTNSDSAEIIIMLDTGGKGVDIILNCCTQRPLNATLRCVADFGRIIYVRDLKSEVDGELGLKMFLRNVAVIHVSMSAVIGASTKVKKEMHGFMRRLITGMLIQPILNTAPKNFQSATTLSGATSFTCFLRLVYRKLIPIITEFIFYIIHALRCLFVTPLDASYQKNDNTYCNICCLRNRKDFQQTLEEINLILPGTSEELNKEAELTSSELDFMQLPSLCPKPGRDSPSLFIIPGMLKSADTLKLSKNLLYPVYVVQYTIHSQSIHEMAGTIARKIKNITQKGPYNVVGLLLGGILAMEVVKVLEQDGAKTHLFLIDGAPDTIQNVILNIGEGYLVEAGLLSRFFKINDIDTINRLKKAPTWDGKLQIVLGKNESLLEESRYLTVILSTFSKHLNEITTYKPSEEVVIGRVTLLRPKGSNQYDTCGLTKYCKYTTDIVISVSDNSMYEDPVAVQAINMNILIE